MIERGNMAGQIAMWKSGVLPKILAPMKGPPTQANAAMFQMIGALGLTLTFLHVMMPHCAKCC